MQAVQIQTSRFGTLEVAEDAVLSALAAVFFLLTDKLIQLAMSLLFGFGA